MPLNGAEQRTGPSLWRALGIAAVIPLVLIGVFVWLSMQGARTTYLQAQIDQAYERRAAIAALISQVKDAETAQRGFVITGDPTFLVPYRQARDGIDERLARLNQLFGLEGPAIRDRVTRISDLVPKKFIEMERVLDAQQTQGAAAGAAIVRQGIGKRLMDQIEKETAAIAARQTSVLTAQRAAAAEQVRRGRQYFFIGVSLVGALAFWVAYLVWAGGRGRHKALVDAIDAGSRQTAIFNSTFNAIILINPSGSIEIMNPAAERLFGYPARDLVRRDISLIADLAPGEGPFLKRLGLRDGALKDPFRPLVTAHRANGTPLPVEVALGLMPLEDGMHIVAVFGDISEREEVEQMKDQFLSTVSHELRTPLTSVVGSLGLLKAGVGDELSPQAYRLVELAEKNANRLIRIVNDILDAEKLRAGQMTFAMTTLDLRDVVATAANGMAGFASVKTISIETATPNEPVMIRGDADRLVQVLNNLLSNAIKFSPARSTVMMSIAADSKIARVSISDQGPGIPEELRGRLFDRFSQASGVARQSMPGTGLGLAISRDILRHHGGTIGVSDGKAGGTVVAFELPLERDTAQQEERNGVPHLLLYTHPAEAEILTAGFAPQNIRADRVHSIDAAVKAVRQRHYLSMIVDFQFGGENAQALIQAVRAEPRGRCLPIVGIAADETHADPRQTAAIDIIDWLHKPIQPRALDDAIAAAMAHAAVRMPLVLHVDDDPDTLEVTAAALSGLARVEHASTVASARAFIAENHVDILIIDIALPDGSGIDLASDVAGPDGSGAPIIIYSAQDGGSDLREAEAVLTKSKKSLPNLVDTILAIRDRHERGRTAE